LHDYHPKDGFILRNAEQDTTGDLPVQVVLDSSVFDIVKCHLQLVHAYIQERLYGFIRDEVEWLLKHCRKCARKKQGLSQAPLRPILATKPWERIQIDLMDMTKTVRAAN